jgi:hypothetical protein
MSFSKTCVGYGGAMTVERVVHFSGGQQNKELLPDGLDDVWWERGRGVCSFIRKL